MKKYKSLVAALALLTGVFGVVSTQRAEVKTEAATVETSRLWAKIVNKDQWDSAGASTYIHYWGGSSSTSWFGVPIKWDSTNDLVYYDVPSNTTGVIFVRVSADKKSVWNQTADLVATGHFNTWYFNLTGYGGGEWKNDITIQTTKVVSDFIATFDSSGEACSSSAAQTVVNSYNNLQTYEQNQFDGLNVGGGVTGLQSLQYLKSFYNIGTPLNVKVASTAEKKNITAIITISTLSLTAITGYYFLKSKKYI